MASSIHHLGEHSSRNLYDFSNMGIGIVVSEWNNEITDALLAGALQCLRDHRIPQNRINVHYVPGSFELPLGAQWLAQRKDIHAVICLGCVIQGETRHFDFICDAVAHGISNVSLKHDKPVIFGVLTTDTQKQALDRAGGKYGNKGDEAAISALKMLGLYHKINSAGKRK